MRNSKQLFYSMLLVMLMPLALNANDLTGFWKIEKVTVGEEEMTPESKWIKIVEDGSYSSGNGWLQHIKGTWTLDTATMLFDCKEDNGIIDPFGPFKLSFSGEKMFWSRDEEGLPVQVSLSRIEEMPMSLSDKIKGLWGLDAVYQKELDITTSYDPERNDYIFLRWDRRLVEERVSGEKNYAYWYIHPHRSELRIADRNADGETERWRVEINNNKLYLYGFRANNKDMKFVYRRLDQFPE